jgi:hypothetical protein
MTYVYVLACPFTSGRVSYDFGAPVRVDVIESLRAPKSAAWSDDGETWTGVKLKGRGACFLSPTGASIPHRCWRVDLGRSEVAVALRYCGPVKRRCAAPQVVVIA